MDQDDSENERKSTKRAKPKRLYKVWRRWNIPHEFQKMSVGNIPEYKWDEQKVNGKNNQVKGYLVKQLKMEKKKKMFIR